MRTQLQKYWDKKREKADTIRQSGKCIIRIHKVYPTRKVTGTEGTMKVVKVRTRLHVTCPYNEDFNAGARQLLGKWRSRSGGVWTFDNRSFDLVVALCNKIYGKAQVTILGANTND